MALNRLYLPHRQLKWQQQLLSGLAVTPERFTERLGQLFAPRQADTFQAAETCWPTQWLSPWPAPKPT